MKQRCTGILRSAFTPGNSEFSGHLPQLITRSRELWRIYYAGFTNLLINRRVSPDSFYGPTYVTIPRVLPYPKLHLGHHVDVAQPLAARSPGAAQAARELAGPGHARSIWPRIILRVKAWDRGTPSMTWASCAVRTITCA